MDAVTLGLAQADAKRRYATLSGSRLHVPRIGSAPVVSMVQACASGHGWTPAGASGASNLDTTNSNANSTEQVLLGSQAVKLVTKGGGTVAVRADKTLGAAFNATGCDVRVWFYVTAAGPLQLVTLTAVSASFANSSANIYAVGGKTSLYDVSVQVGWNVIDVPQSAFGGTVDWTAVTGIQFSITDQTAVATVYFAGWAWIQQAPTNLFPKGVLSITADDSFASQYTVLRPLLDAYGWRATLFPIIDQIGAPSYLTMAQVVSLHDDYGWEIAAHASTGAIHAIGWDVLTQSQRLAEAEAIKKWQEQYGFDSPTFAYPLGRWSGAARKDVRRYFSVGRLANLSHPQPQYSSTPYALDSINIGSQYGKVASVVPQLVSGKAWGSIVIHDTVASGATGNDTTTANLVSALAAIASSGVAVVPMGQVVRTLAA